MPNDQFLNRLFTVTRKGRCQRQTTRAEFDCLFSGTRGEAEGAGGAPESEPDESMNSRVSWSVDGIDPFVRERAEAAARRAGMSLNDWLNSTFGDPTPADFRATADQRPPGQETRDVADIHQRLDAITRQIEQITHPAPLHDAPRGDAVRSEPGVARQLNDAISRLDARLSQISNPAPRHSPPQDRQRQADMVERAATHVYRPSPPLSPALLESAIAEIAARQHEPDHATPRPMTPRSTPPLAPAMPPAGPPGPDFSTPERHRRPGAGRGRARARRNSRSVALADTGRATRRL